MSADKSLAPISLQSPQDGSAELIEYTAQETPPTTNPLHAIHSLLRGRYKLAITLAIIGLILGAPIGYFAQKPKYKSVGVIRIRPTTPKLLYSTEQNGAVPMFESFMASQVAELQGPRVITEAMHSPEWSATNRSTLPADQAEFLESLDVINPRNTPLLQVSFTDSDPKAAGAAVRAVIKKYEEGFPVLEGETDAMTQNRLAELKRSAQLNLSALQTQIRSAANDVEPDSLLSQYNAKLQEQNRLESQLHEAQAEAARAGVTLQPNATTSPATTAPSRADMLLAADPLLQRMEQAITEMRRDERIALSRLGANNPQLAEIRTRIAVFEQDARARTEQVRRQSETNPNVLVDAGPDNGAISAEKLRSRLYILRELTNGQAAAVKELARKINLIEQLRIEAQAARDQLADVTKRLDQWNVEKDKIVGRVNVISYGEVPVTPDKDKRKALAAVGGLGLAGLGVGIVALLGYMDRRMHHIDAAHAPLKRTDRMLGVLPDLPTDLSDPEQASAAAFCVHRIRAMLQIRQRTTGHKIFSVTSPAPGDGKTSLTITLGMSLASSGCRTLLVDCDMDGGGLTSRFGHVARKPLGQILLDAGAIGEARLQEAIELARKEGLKLGKALVRLEFVSEQTVREALSEQKLAAPGLIDVIDGAAIDRAIQPTGYPSLSVLPLGSAAGVHSARLSPAGVRRMLDQLAGRYDMVLIDCGPILGSIDASIVAAEADGVILVVSRGGDRRAAEGAASLLMSAGAELEGLVFNRAGLADIARSRYSSSASIRSMQSSARPRTSGFGDFETAAVMHGSSRLRDQTSAEKAATGESAR